MASPRYSRHSFSVNNQVEKISYDVASAKFQEIADKNAQGVILLSLPYQIGIGMGVTAAFASIPLVFDLSTAEWFNKLYVTTDVPEPEDLETMLEVRICMLYDVVYRVFKILTWPPFRLVLGLGTGWSLY